MKHIAEAIILAALILTIGYSCNNCESENINQCGRSCERTERKMDHYSRNDGCVCAKDR